MNFLCEYPAVETAGCYIYNKISEIYLVHKLKEEDTMWMITIDAEKCEGCEECVSNCPVTVFEMKDGKAEPFQVDLCEGCETCTSVCPTEAVTLTEM